jgi:hypothetical protein
MTPAARQIFERVKTIEALEWNMGHIFRLGEAKVDSDPGPAVFRRL